MCVFVLLLDFSCEKRAVRPRGEFSVCVFMPLCGSRDPYSPPFHVRSGAESQHSRMKNQERSPRQIGPSVYVDMMSLFEMGCGTQATHPGCQKVYDEAYGRIGNTSSTILPPICHSGRFLSSDFGPTPYPPYLITRRCYTSSASKRPHILMIPKNVKVVYASGVREVCSV